MDFAIVGVILGVASYFSFMGYYFLYLPKKFRKWFERSNARLFILDFALTFFGTIAFSKLSDSLTAVIAGVALGVLGTITTIGMITVKKIKYVFTGELT